jgi:hypothetical protein
LCAAAGDRRQGRLSRRIALDAPRPGPHDGTIITDKVNEMWGTDMTQTITIREGRAKVFVAVEHANSEVVGIHASRSANRFEALEPKPYESRTQQLYRLADGSTGSGQFMDYLSKRASALSNSRRTHNRDRSHSPTLSEQTVDFRG